MKKNIYIAGEDKTFKEALNKKIKYIFDLNNVDSSSINITTQGFGHKFTCI